MIRGLDLTLGDRSAVEMTEQGPSFTSDKWRWRHFGNSLSVFVHLLPLTKSCSTAMLKKINKYER